MKLPILTHLLVTVSAIALVGCGSEETTAFPWAIAAIVLSVAGSSFWTWRRAKSRPKIICRKF